MSEGDLRKGSPVPSSSELQTQSEDELNESIQLGGQRSSTSSPSRSRSQSAGSAHREALEFFERHQLFQSNTDLSNPQPGNSGGKARNNIIRIDVDPGTDLELLSGGDSTEISSFSKSPSPAHVSDAPSSTSTEESQKQTTHSYYQHNYICDGKGQLSVLDNQRPSGSHRARSKSDTLTLLVKNSDAQTAGTSDTKTFIATPASSTSSRVCGGPAELIWSGESSPSRNRSIRGRSHSQPSQVLLNTVTTTSGQDTSRYGTVRKGSKREKYITWLEGIQFRAQYQHFISTDYASVVKSASSLDKVSTGDNKTRVTNTNFTHQIGEPPHSSHHQEIQIHGRSGSGGADLISGGNESLSQAHGFSPSKHFCWNFPRVKLRRIFNAKSLDDILGRSRESSLVNPSSSDEQEHSHKGCFENPSSDTSSSGAKSGTVNIGTKSGYPFDTYSLQDQSKNTSLTSLKIQKPLSTSNNKSIGVYSGSSSSETVGEGSYSKSCQALPVFSSSPVSPAQRGTKGDKPKSHSLTSTLTSVLLRVPQFHSSGNTTSSHSTKENKKFQKKGNKKEKPSKSLSSGSLNRVACAKSNNYLNRFVSSATCARFNVGKSVDNLNTNIITSPNISSPTGKIETHNKSTNSFTSCTKTSVKPFSSNNKSASGTTDPISSGSSSSQPQQRRWTAVKHKWDLKLQPSADNPEGTPDSNNTHYQQNLLFIKTQLSQIGVPSGESKTEEACQLESLTSNTDNPHQTVLPHEPGRVSFRLEPEEIPPRISPPISRSQSSDCRPTEIDPNLLINPSAEEESEEMNKSRHFHYRDRSGPIIGGSSSHRRKDHHYPHHEDLSPNKASEMTTKGKAQLVVANLSYLQRPTSPCLILGDPSASFATTTCSSPTQQQQSQQSSSSPIVFTNNNNYPTNPQIHSQSQSQSHRHYQQQSSSVLSPTSPLSSAQQHARMKQEYFRGTVGGFYFDGTTSPAITNITNLNEPEQICKNINKSSTQSGTGKGASSFALCYNRNDVVSPTRGIFMPSAGTTTTTTGMKFDGAKTKGSFYGGDDRVQHQEFGDPLLRHDDINISNKKKDNQSNKNVIPTGGSSLNASSSRDHPGGCGSGPRRLDGDSNPSSLFSTDTVTKAGPDFPTQYGYENRNSQSQDSPAFGSQIGSPSNLGNQEEVELFALSSSRRNNNFQSIESTEDEDEMGDLQSPTYVKRTAHMFNSRYSTQHNGSGSNVSDSIKENRNPSYLNVSRSVSGYSCLSYNNGVASNGSSVSATTTTINTNTSNGSPYSQKFISSPPTTKIRSEFTVKVNQPQLRDHHSQYDNDNDMGNEEGRLIKSPSLGNKSRYISADHATASSYDDDGSDSSPVVVDSSYTPSHGKSFIMQRIERLYGSDAVNAASVFSRSGANTTKSGVTTTTTTIKCETSYQSPISGKEHIIPIQVERDDNNRKSQNENQVAKVHQRDKQEDHYERRIRGDEMLITAGDNYELISPTKQSNNNMKSAEDNFTSRNSNISSITRTTGGVYEGVSLESCPGKHKLHTISLDEEERKVLISPHNAFRNGDNRPKSSPSPILDTRRPSIPPGKHVNGNNSFTNGNAKKNDSGIVVDDKEILDNESEHFNTYANDSRNVSFNESLSITESPSKLTSRILAAKLPTRKSPTSSGPPADDSGILEPEETEEKPSSSLYSYRKTSLSSSGGSSEGGSPEPGNGGSPLKPKLKPKPKDMALLRTLSQSPTHKGLHVDRNLGSIQLSESQDNVVLTTGTGISLEKIIGVQGQDRTDASELENNRRLSDIRNVLKPSSPLDDDESCGGESKSFKSSTEIKPSVGSTMLSTRSEDTSGQTDKENELIKSEAKGVAAKDGNYFLNEMLNTKKQLQLHVDKATKYLDEFDEQSEQAGNILSVIGKSNLLMKKKFKQFEELCHANLRGVTGDQPETTDEDLAGFWDMVMIQVDQVYSLFNDLDGKDKAQSTDVPDGSKSKSTVSPRKAVSSSTKVIKPSATKSQSSAAAKARDESRRKMLAERRRLMKNQEAGSASTNQEDIVIFTPENN